MSNIKIGASVAALWLAANVGVFFVLAACGILLADPRDSWFRAFVTNYIAEPSRWWILIHDNIGRQLGFGKGTYPLAMLAIAALLGLSTYFFLQARRVGKTV